MSATLELNNPPARNDLSGEADAWNAQALCSTGNGDLVGVFFSDDLADISAAKSLCAQCPVMLECLEGALARREPAGVWGGQLFSGGRIVARKRRPGRPSAVPRPGDEMLEIPVPVHLRGFLRTA